MQLRRQPARFLSESRGAVSIETLIVLPTLVWALVATVVFFDGFRSRNQTQMAAFTVADLLSRHQNNFTAEYLEGMNDVFDFLADSRFPTRMRVSSVIWNSANQRNALQWSYGTRGFAPLPEETFQFLQDNDHPGLVALFGQEEGHSFVAAAAQAPRADLADRIPPVLPGEAMILVESFALWSPFANVGVGQVRFAPIVSMRPRFTPWINLEGAIPVFPEDDYEVAFAGYVPGVVDLPDPNAPGDPVDPPPFDQPVVVVSQNFANNDATAWSRTTVTGTASLGNFLGPFGNETFATPLTRPIVLPSGTARAVIEFDLLIIDSWDGLGPDWAPTEGETITLMIDGQPISIDAFQVDGGGLFARNRLNSVVLPGGAVWGMTMQRTMHGSNFTGAGWNDQRWRVRIEGEAPPQTFSLGISARLNEDVSNESFGIANFSVTAHPGTPQPAAWAPVAANAIGTHPQTRFPIYRGCPDRRIGAAALHVANSDLSSPLQINRQAGGGTHLNDCPEISGSARFHASATYVLHWNNQGLSGTGNRLRVAMEDGNSGRTCDTALVIRDPNGQFWFNDDISSSNYNARLNLGNAASGAYHIWIGTWAGNTCTARLDISRY